MKQTLRDHGIYQRRSRRIG